MFLARELRTQELEEGTTGPVLCAWLGMVSRRRKKTKELHRTLRCREEKEEVSGGGSCRRPCPPQRPCQFFRAQKFRGEICFRLQRGWGFLWRPRVLRNDWRFRLSL